jgi:hypothetical protein
MAAAENEGNVHVPTTEDFKLELVRIIYEATQRGDRTVDVTAGELHRRVGEYPGANHRMPVCCEVMRNALIPDYGDSILEEPPSGQGASFKARYVLPRLEPVS